MATQPEHRTQNPRQGGHHDQEGHSCGPKGLGPKESKSGLHDASQPMHFWAPNDIIRYAIEELLGLTA
jgi:hypothetical protein